MSAHLILIVVDNVPVGGFGEREHMRLQQAQLLPRVFVYVILRGWREGEIKLVLLLPLINKIARPLVVQFGGKVFLYGSQDACCECSFRLLLFRSFIVWLLSLWRTHSLTHTHTIRNFRKPKSSSRSLNEIFHPDSNKTNCQLMAGKIVALLG